jgi:NitT/TauT family transport system permease protein
MLRRALLRASKAMIVGVVAEMPIWSAGSGFLIPRCRTVLYSPHVFAGVLLVLTIAFNALIRLIERRAAVWRVGTRAGRDAMAPSAVGQAA